MKAAGPGLIVIVAVAATFAPAASTRPAPQSSAAVTVSNPLAAARPAETIEVSVDALRRVLAFDDVRRVHVRDGRDGRDLLTQAVDTDDNGTFEYVIFQADLAASERRAFTLTVGERHVATRDEYRAYGRFVRERRDDFVWENDLVAHRMYGAALETWPQEPLTSSAVDVWVKNTPRLVANDWYMTDDYHVDHGEGADMYSAGATRGCGGNGVWTNGKLYPSVNFRGSRVLANGPIRVMFELTYDAWDAGGRRVSEVKRIQLDAGHRLNRFESTYRVPEPQPLQQAAGVRKNPGAERVFQRETGVLRTWEPFKDNAGFLGCAVMVDPGEWVDAAEDNGSFLIVTRVPGGAPAVYYAGSAWDRGGTIKTPALWDEYLALWARRWRAPVSVTVGGR